MKRLLFVLTAFVYSVGFFNSINGFYSVAAEEMTNMQIKLIRANQELRGDFIYRIDTNERLRHEITYSKIKNKYFMEMAECLSYAIESDNYDRADQIANHVLGIAKEHFNYNTNLDKKPCDEKILNQFNYLIQSLAFDGKAIVLSNTRRRTTRDFNYDGKLCWYAIVLMLGSPGIFISDTTMESIELIFKCLGFEAKNGKVRGVMKGSNYYLLAMLYKISYIRKLESIQN
jgi:hypothetical protein